ncbi:MAG: hypothetical protein MPEBLZ_02461, partial [Candidatus Methanoperedens nitroreducens]
MEKKWVIGLLTLAVLLSGCTGPTTIPGTTPGVTPAPT